MKIIRLKESDINRMVKKVLIKEKKPLNEIVGLALGIMLWRTTATSKANRLTRHIKQSLRDRGIRSKNIEGGNLNKLLKCVNGFVVEYEEKSGSGDAIKKTIILPGKKQMDKSLVRKKAGTKTFDSSFENFKKTLPPKIKKCSDKYGLSPSESATLSEVIINTIEDFANKKLRL